MRANRSVLSFALLLNASLPILSCATGSSLSGGKASGERREIVGLEEMSLEYVQTLWGSPDQNVPAGKGRTVRFKNIRTEDENPITGVILVKYCDVRLDVNDRQLVQSWLYEICRGQK